MSEERKQKKKKRHTGADVAVPARDGVSRLAGAVGGPLGYGATRRTDMGASVGSRQGGGSSRV